MDNICSISQERQRLIVSVLVNTMQYQSTLKNSIYESKKWEPPPLFHLDTNPVLGRYLIHFVDKADVLVVTVELIWLLFLNIHSFNFALVQKNLC